MLSLESNKVRNLKITTLLQHFVGGGIQFMNGDLQESKNPNYLLQPYRIHQMYKETNVNTMCKKWNEYNVQVWMNKAMDVVWTLINLGEKEIIN